MKVTIYEYPPCSTCRDAIKSLKQKGHEVTRINIKENPPTVSELKKLIQQSGLDIRKFFNVNGLVYREMKLKDKYASLSDDEKLALLASNGMLIKRPIVTDGIKATVGYKEEAYEEVWG